MTESTATAPATWVPDLLGEPFVARTIELHADAISTQDLVATLVRYGTPAHRRAVLYVHGFSDYFFQSAHAARLEEDGALDVYAIDLRRCGRSLRPGQDAADVRDLAEYDEEIGAALRIVRDEGHDEVVLLGHSTGGLVVTLYAHHHPRSVEAVVLNSPWYDINDTPLRRATSAPLATLVALREPERVLSRMQGYYTPSLHRSTGGEWDFDLGLKPLAGFPVRAAWLRAVRRAQYEVSRGTPLRAPVLMCTSSRSGGRAGARPTPEELRTSDCVLDVAHMWRVVPHLGEDVTLRTIPGGLHDLALSAERPRQEYEAAVLAWIGSRLGPTA